MSNIILINAINLLNPLDPARSLSPFGEGTHKPQTKHNPTSSPLRQTAASPKAPALLATLRALSWSGEAEFWSTLEALKDDLSRRTLSAHSKDVHRRASEMTATGVRTKQVWACQCAGNDASHHQRVVLQKKDLAASSTSSSRGQSGFAVNPDLFYCQHRDAQRDCNENTLEESRKHLDDKRRQAENERIAAKQNQLPFANSRSVSAAPNHLASQPPSAMHSHADLASYVPGAPTSHVRSFFQPVVRLKQKLLGVPSTLPSTSCNVSLFDPASAHQTGVPRLGSRRQNCARPQMARVQSLESHSLGMVA